MLIAVMLLVRTGIATETRWLQDGAILSGESTCPAGVERENRNSCAGGPRGWLDVDYLMWWTSDARLPPLVTSSPPIVPRSQAGVVGDPATTVLFGNDRVNDAMRSGLRLDGGVWFDGQRTCGLAFDFLALESRTVAFRGRSAGDPILARPFDNAVTGRPEAELVAYPGVVSGSVQAAAGSPGIWGWGINYRKNLCCCSDCCAGGGTRTDWLIGYRHLRLDDQIAISEQLDSPLFMEDTQFSIDDRFSTRNSFHGLELGLIRSERHYSWELDYFAKVALGWNDASVRIQGATTVAAPGFPPVVNEGGLLALASNSGRYDETQFTAVLQVGTNLAYRLTDHLSLRLGYTLLFWPEVFRAADQIDTTINPNLLPPPLVPLVGPARPAVPLAKHDFWAQGLNLGLVYRF